MGALLEQEGYDLAGAAMEVYRCLGSGYLESVYQESLEVELAIRDIPFETQPVVKIQYKGMILNQTYRPDLIVHGGIVVELKALKNTGSVEAAQVLNYLKASELRVGYLLNFGAARRLQWQRYVL